MAGTRILVEPRLQMSRHGNSILLYALLVMGAIPILIPFVWMVSSSLKTKEHVGDNPPRLLPWNEHTYIHANGQRVEVIKLAELPDKRAKVRFPDGRTETVAPTVMDSEWKVEPQWANYGKLLDPKTKSSDDDFARFLLNTLLICGLAVIGQALTSAMVGWGFARMRFAGKNVLFMTMLATMMLPGQVSMIPVFMIYRRLGWIDTFLPLIVPAWFGSAFFAFLYRQYFMGIPVEMDEAAKVDGAGPLRVFWSILLPMAKPVTVTVAVFTFLGTWNDFLGPLIYINSDHKRTLSLALAKFQSAYATDIPAIMAGATLMLIPVLLIYFFSQRALVRGMVVSGVKG
jgi:ABC-type glycerol-3-phosphate transport system permease component